MALRNVIHEGDPALRRTSREVPQVTDRIREIMEDMVETMRASHGVGLAGPQVGIMRRIFVAEPNPEADPPVVYYMINPEIYETEGEIEDDEGCLSVPGLIGTVKRPERIKIRALDLDGNQQDYEFTDFAARIMCHETDHLNGVLYIDKATNIREPEEIEEEDEEDIEREEMNQEEMIQGNFDQSKMEQEGTDKE